MLYKVQTPDGNIVKVEAPEGASQQAIFDYVKSQRPDVVKDVASAIPAGLIRGGASAAMMLPEMMNAAVAAPQYLYEGLIGQNRPDFQPVQPFYNSSDVLGMLPQQLQPYQPKTPMGQAVGTASEFAGNLLAPAAMQKGYNKITQSPFVQAQSSVPKPKPFTYTAQDVKTASGKAFNEFASTQGEFNSGWLDRTLSRVKKVAPQTQAGQVVAGETPATQLIGRLEKLRETPLTLQAFKEVDDEITRTINGHLNPVTGTVDANGLQLQKIQDEFRKSALSAGKRDLMLPKLANKDDLAAATNELDSLKRLEKELVSSVERNAKGNTTVAAGEAKNLAAVRQQIEAQGKNIDAIKADIKAYPTKEAEAERAQKALGKLKGARKLWSEQLKLSELENIATRAELTQNPANSIKASIRTILSNPSRRRAYSMEERKMLRKAADSGYIGDLVNTMGSRLSQVVALGSGNVGQSLAVGAGSGLARNMASQAALNRLGNVNQSIAQRAMGAQPAPYATPYPQVNPLNFGLLSAGVNANE